VPRETRPASTSEREPAASPQGQIEAIALVFEGHRWTATDGETRVRVPDTKGMRYVANLVARPETERHVLDLVDAVEGLDPHARTARRRLGDAGELLDARARTEYRREIGPLHSDIDDALQFGNDVRAAVLQEQLDQLSRQLLAAFGSRRARPPSRLGVGASPRQRDPCFRAATARLIDEFPDPGLILDRRIRTGRYCAYEPLTDDPVRWRCLM
jgi:hypothetical protein